MLVDPHIRDNVLLPLLVFVAITTFLRIYVFQLLQPAEASVTASELKQKSVVARSQRLRTNGGYITPHGFAMRKEYLLGTAAEAELRRQIEADAPTTSGGAASSSSKPGKLKEEVTDPAPNPMAQFDTMKLQMVNQFMYFGLFYAIQSALAGFLVVKLPFGLTERFKAITQQGIGVPALDTSWVSSGSFYIIAQNGMQRLIDLGMAAARRGRGAAGSDEAKMLQMAAGMGPAMMMGGGMGGPQGWQPKTAFAAEAAALNIAQYSSQLVDAEADLLVAAAAALR